MSSEFPDYVEDILEAMDKRPNATQITRDKDETDLSELCNLLRSGA